MTGDTGKEGVNAEQPPKKRLDISIFLKRAAGADTLIGRVFLFPLLGRTVVV
jgi:hypothetical protein